MDFFLSKIIEGDIFCLFICTQIIIQKKHTVHIRQLIQLINTFGPLMATRPFTQFKSTFNCPRSAQIKILTNELCDPSCKKSILLSRISNCNVSEELKVI